MRPRHASRRSTPTTLCTPSLTTLHHFADTGTAHDGRMQNPPTPKLIDLTIVPSTRIPTPHDDGASISTNQPPFAVLRAACTPTSSSRPQRTWQGVPWNRTRYGFDRAIRSEIQVRGPPAFTCTAAQHGVLRSQQLPPLRARAAPSTGTLHSFAPCGPGPRPRVQRGLGEWERGRPRGTL